MPKESSRPSHCPGFEKFRSLSSFVCKCPECGKDHEIFSDEFEQPHTCRGCGNPIDFTRCSLDAQGGDTTAR